MRQKIELQNVANVIPALRGTDERIGGENTLMSISDSENDDDNDNDITAIGGVRTQTTGLSNHRGEGVIKA